MSTPNPIEKAAQNPTELEPQTTTPTPARTETQPQPNEIDALLHRYLALLDTYTSLRDSLNGVQASLFQSLARANFVSADRGRVHYGQDYYDQRMQASRRVRIRRGGKSGEGEGVGEGKREGAVVVDVEVYPPPGVTSSAGDEGGGEEGVEDGVDEKKQKESDSEDKDQEEKDQEEKGTPKPTDPLRWFGILTPLPLRQAQAQAIKAVEELIPRLASISAEMAEVELEVRRARKKRAKAEKAEEKKFLELGGRAEEVGAVA